MKDKIGNILWGSLIVAFGVGYLGNSLNWWNYQLFFDGWWTLIIIIPAITSIVQSGVKVLNTSAFIGGVLLLLNAQNMLPDNITTIIMPILIIAVGVYVLLKGFDYNQKK